MSKFSYLWIFLIVFVCDKAHNSFDGPVVKNKQTEKTSEIKQAKTIQNEQPDDNSPAKRKRKPRGIEVDVPHISDVSFEQPFLYRYYSLFKKQDIYSKSDYCVHRKRGPPLV